MSAKSVLLEPQHLLDPDLEHTLIVVKPDGYARGLTGEILRRIEAKGYTIKGLKLMIASRELLAEHYADHKDKPFFEGLLEFMSSGPVVAIIVEGQRVVEACASSWARPTRRRPPRARSAETWVARGTAPTWRT